MFSLLGKRMFPWYNVGVKLGQIHPFISNTMRINYSRTVVVSLKEKKVLFDTQRKKKQQQKHIQTRGHIHTKNL